MRLPALETLQSEPCIYNTLFLQSSLHTRHHVIWGFVFVFFFNWMVLPGSKETAGGCFWFTLRTLSDAASPQICFPFREHYLEDGAGITPASWWWPRSLLAMRSHLRWARTENSSCVFDCWSVGMFPYGVSRLVSSLAALWLLLLACPCLAVKGGVFFHGLVSCRSRKRVWGNSRVFLRATLCMCETA